MNPATEQIERFLRSLSSGQRLAYRFLLRTRRQELQTLLATLASAASHAYAQMDEAALELQVLDSLEMCNPMSEGGSHGLSA